MTKWEYFLGPASYYYHFSKQWY